MDETVSLWLPLFLLPFKTRKGQSCSYIISYSCLDIPYIKTIWSADKLFPWVAKWETDSIFSQAGIQTNKPIWLHKSYFLWKKLHITVLFFLGFLRSQNPKVLIQNEILLLLVTPTQIDALEWASVSEKPHIFRNKFGKKTNTLKIL